MKPRLVALGEERWRRAELALSVAVIAALSKPGDLVVISPWFLGVPFRRYYRGAAEWTTLPPLSDLRRSRYDLLKQRLSEPDPIRPVLGRIRTTIRRGKTAWWLGLPTPPRDLPPLPPAPASPWGWYSAPHLTAWGSRAMEVLRAEGAVLERVPVETRGVSDAEPVVVLAARCRQ